VEIDPDEDTMGRTYLKKITTHSTKELGAFIRQNAAAGTTVITDGLPSYAFSEAGYEHITIWTNLFSGSIEDGVWKTSSIN